MQMPVPEQKIRVKIKREVVFINVDKIEMIEYL